MGIKEIKVGKYYLIESRTRKPGKEFIGICVLSNKGGYFNSLTFKLPDGTLWWTTIYYVIREVPEHVAVLEMLR